MLRCTSILALSLAVTGAADACDHFVGFESQAPGTTYGSPAGHAPGDLAFIEDDVVVRVRMFDAGIALFNFSAIEPFWPGFGVDHVMNVNNINLDFDLTRLRGCAQKVTFDFLDYGGTENLKVNGSPIFVGELIAAPPVMGGVEVFVSAAPFPGGGGIEGTVTLVGHVERFSIGGQEFFMDRVCIDTSCPEDVDCDGAVGFADLSAMLSAWGACAGCPEDVNGDGAVGFADLAALLAAWGSC